MSAVDTQASRHESLLAKLLSETARCEWRDLERFFAQGKVLRVDDAHDLVVIGAAIASDDASTLTPLIDAGELAPPSNDHARRWHAENQLLWTLVVAPYVLVQETRVT
ncbi:hypothetical protein GCM10008090_27200 [Arenicella chitinivorans]|uniref:DUF2288 domain-containing protein n=1 Tax=Arenicella chitinivorans TaxID=1329800 RepID=A0A918VR21_9GAMM|nr:DUF2288 domain-containing protein [Arenicella chitinivorans]GHA16015.1 hypothetical protein GCM10008090_27200 [Arenicella chitinivorans]